MALAAYARVEAAHQRTISVSETLSAVLEIRITPGKTSVSHTSLVLRAVGDACPVVQCEVCGTLLTVTYPIILGAVGD